jgi:hypothetical protein
MHTEQLLAEIAEGQGEKLIRLARRVPRTRRDRPVTLGCLLRWVTSGVTGPDGKRIYLEAARLSGRWISSPAALRRFVEAQQPCADAKETPVLRSPARRRRELQQAEKALYRAGV